MQKLHSLSRLSSAERRPLLGIGCAVLLLLAGCGPNVPRADAMEAQADSLMSVQAYGAAIDTLQKAVKYDSNEPRRWVKLGRAQRAAGMPALAAMSFQHALDLDPANVESLQNLSILEVRAGRYDDAKTYVDPLMVLSPDDVAGLLALGAIALYKRQLPQGLGYADKLIKIAPSSLGGYSLKAHILDAMGRPGEASKVLAQQAVFNPDDKDLALQLLQLYQKSGNRDGIRDTAINLARLIPDDPRYQMEAARALWARGNTAKADQIINGLVRRYPYLPEISMAASQFWQATLPSSVATARIVDMAGQAKGATKAALCDQLIAGGQVKTVIKLLTPYYTNGVNSENVDVVAIYAKALYLTADYKKAKAVADDILGFDYSNDDALIVRARVALLNKKFEDALNDAQQAVANDNQNPDAAILVPQIYDAWGRRVLAARAWGDASSHMPESLEVLSARIDWLFRTKQPDIAVSLASFFARGHDGNRAAWELYRDTCVTAQDDYCTGEANQKLDHFKARKPPKAKV